MNVQLKKAISVTGKEARYDECAKRLLSEKIVLAHILVKVVDEFRGMKPQDVVRYIEGEPLVSKVPVDPGTTNINIEILEKEGGKKEANQFQPEEVDMLEELYFKERHDVSGKGTRIVGFNTINQELNEGTNIFDIIFYVRMKNGIARIIINIEIQKDEPTKYHILNRIIFYVSRMISSQKQRDFIHSDYNDMKEVYSIWICTGEKENTLNNIHLSDNKLIGAKKWKGNLNLFNAVIIGLSNKLPEHDATYALHRLLGVLLSDRLEYHEKIEILKNEYALELPNELEMEVRDMCNLGQGIREKAEREGEERMGKLSELLVRLNRPLDIAKAVQDVTYRQKLYQEFGL